MSDLPDAPSETVSTAPRIRSRLCMECGVEFSPKVYQQEFCSTPHKKRWNNRRLAEGAAVVTLMKAWRAARNAKGSSDAALADKAVGSKALSEMVSIIDGFMADDRAAGRPNPIPYVRRSLADGKRYMDRARTRK